MATNERIEKPPKVILAVKLFYLVIGVSVIRAIMTVIRHADVRSPYVFIIWKLLLYMVGLFLIYQLGKGKNWAKWSLVLILALSFPLAISPALDVISVNPVQPLLLCIQVILYIIGMICLFDKSSSPWFSSAEKVSKKQ